jgi:hypothetical protein
MFLIVHDTSSSTLNVNYAKFKFLMKCIYRMWPLNEEKYLLESEIFLQVRLELSYWKFIETLIMSYSYLIE